MVLGFKHGFVDVNLSDGEGRTALRLACLSRRVAVVRMLLERKDTDVNKSPEQNPLNAVAGFASKGEVQYLRENGHVTGIRQGPSHVSEIAAMLLAHPDINVNLR